MNTLKFWMLVGLLLLPIGYSDATTLLRYNVSGNTVDELIASMKANGPGKGAWAKTTNFWSYTASIESNSERARISSIEVTWTVEITMPNWPGYRQASKCMRRSWDSMYTSLRAHEDTHVALAEPVKGLLEQAAANIGELGSHDEVDRTMKSALKLIVAENRELQQKFDRATNHGQADKRDPVIFRRCR